MACEGATRVLNVLEKYDSISILDAIKNLHDKVKEFVKSVSKEIIEDWKSSCDLTLDVTTLDTLDTNFIHWLLRKPKGQTRRSTRQVMTTYTNRPVELPVTPRAELSSTSPPASQAGTDLQRRDMPNCLFFDPSLYGPNTPFTIN